MDLNGIRERKTGLKPHESAALLWLKRAGSVKTWLFSKERVFFFLLEEAKAFLWREKTFDILDVNRRGIDNTWRK